MTKHSAILACAALLLTLTGGCTGVPDGVEVVRGVDAERYLGTWYEIARLDHRFERGLADVSATYSPRDDGGIHVVNRGFDTDKGDWDEASGKAYFIETRDTGRLKVSFFGPFYGGYNIIALDKQDYSYSMVAGPNRDYLWILARSTQPDEQVVAALIAQANALGFATDELIRVAHGVAPVAAD